MCGRPIATPAALTFLWVVVLLVGVHSLMLGIWICLATGPFYRLFFGCEAADPFFVRQAGLFLFCLGMFYVWPLVALRRLHRGIVLTIVTKVLAVVFLVSNASLTPSPATIQLVALGDGCMGALLLITYVVCNVRGVF
jgi:hypothetical protein